MKTAGVVVRCRDLDAVLAFYTGELGFRIDTVFPADRPAWVVVSGYGMRLRLERIDRGQLSAATWQTGRAGMEYRDLIPDRAGGRLIASQIRIVSGGSVPDYVHYHDVRFQLIYCYAGWVRVAYEDQGPPLVMRPGDCVLQPPGIRHRVLECSPGLEVIEVASPAEHVTHADHDLELPTPQLRPERSFSGQRFVHHVAAEARWACSSITGFERRDCGIAGVRVWRCAEAARVTCEAHDDGIVFVFVLAGGVTLDRDGCEPARLGRGDCYTIPAGTPHGLRDCAPGTELLEVTLSVRENRV